MNRDGDLRTRIALRYTFAMNLEHHFDSRDVLWIGLIAFVILAIAFLLPIYPNDFWWYLRIGREIIQARAIPELETLSYYQAGNPVVYPAWLAGCAFWLTQQLAGISGNAGLRGSLVLGFYIFVWLSCRRVGAGRALASGLTLLAALAGSSNWGARPQLFAYLLFGLSLWVLICWRNGDNRKLWLLPVASLLWVNMHGSFPLSFLLGAAAWIGGGGDRRRLAITLGISLAFSLINPKGFNAWIYFAGMIRNEAVREFSSEWRPPVNQGWQAGLFYAWCLLFVPLAARTGRKLGLGEWLWFLGFGWLAFSGVRNVIFFLGVLAVLSAKLLAPLRAGQTTTLSKSTHPRLNYGLGAILMALSVLFLPGLRERWWTNSPATLSTTTPVAAAEWLRNHPDLSGPLWSDLAFASYVEYALPNRPVWIDTRFEVYPVEQWERYVAISQADPGWEILLEGTGARLLMVSRVDQPRLVEALKQASTWCERYRDTVAVIFSRQHRESDCQATQVGWGGND